MTSGHGHICREPRLLHWSFWVATVLMHDQLVVCVYVFWVGMRSAVYLHCIQFCNLTEECSGLTRIFLDSPSLSPPPPNGDLIVTPPRHGDLVLPAGPETSQDTNFEVHDSKTRLCRGSRHLHNVWTRWKASSWESTSRSIRLFLFFLFWTKGGLSWNVSELPCWEMSQRLSSLRRTKAHKAHSSEATRPLLSFCVCVCVFFFFFFERSKQESNQEEICLMVTELLKWKELIANWRALPEFHLGTENDRAEVVQLAAPDNSPQDTCHTEI